MSGSVAYNPDDPAQAALLAGLAQGETGGAANSAFLGTGGTDLSGASTDAYGFPIWGGVGNSTAAGTYQFTQTTWDEVAQKYNLNFQNPSDQAAGAWYLAQDRYASQTGGSLEDALNAGLAGGGTQGSFANIQSALAPTWTSASGNGSLPGGLSGFLSSDVAANGGSSFGVSPAMATSLLGGVGGIGGSSGGSSSSSQGWVVQIENWFERTGLVIAGGVIAALALWAILSHYNVMPGPGQVMKGLAA